MLVRHYTDSLPPPSDRRLVEIARERRGSERRRVRVLAKLLAGGEREEAALLVDLSDTGVRLRIARDVPLSLEEVLRAAMLVRVDDGAEREVHRLWMSLVRVARVTEDQVELAFRFTDESRADARRLRKLGNLIFTA